MIKSNKLDWVARHGALLAAMRPVEQGPMLFDLREDQYPTPRRSPARPRHPVNAEALSYWDSKRGSRTMPARKDIDPQEIVRLLPHIVLLDVTSEPLDFRYRLIGTHVDYHLSEPRTGQWLRQLPHQAPGSIMWATFETVVTERRPVVGDIPYVGPHKDFKRVEDVVMPLSDDDIRVNMLVSCVVFMRKDENLNRFD